MQFEEIDTRSKARRRRIPRHFSAVEPIKSPSKFQNLEIKNNVITFEKMGVKCQSPWELEAVFYI